MKKAKTSVKCIDVIKGRGLVTLSSASAELQVPNCGVELVVNFSIKCLDPVVASPNLELP
eukprot:snap_masked-scaffold_12-processed-gene-10.50-mRNA-1 protein AED:1.00 eAED:1.00 QI:0/0/0/0/1/1/2/0/59